MEIGRLKRIIDYSDRCGCEIQKKVQDFYGYIGMEQDKELRNLMQIVRPLFQKKGFIIVEIPFKDKEIGAVCYKGDALGYSFLNTTLPRANVNFALCHEIYHLFYQKDGMKKIVELYINEHYHEYEEELAANLFAGMLLMPEQSYRYMFDKFAKEDDSRFSILVKLMSYFEVPYMAALIRCYELKLLESGDTLKELIQMKAEDVRAEFARLWLDESILEATKKDDYEKFESLIRYFGEEYQKDGYFNQRALQKAVKNMRILYEKIKGE